jgi:large subunit ribosomal protein L12
MREEINKMENIYAALLLHKLGKEVDEKNLKSVVAAAGGQIDESKIKSLVASLKGVDIDKELENASLVAAAPASSDAPKEKKEAKIEEKKEAAAEGLSALFG